MPNTVYQSNGVPFGGTTITISRPSIPLTPGTGATALNVGGATVTYVLESITPTYNAILGKRPAADGGDNGWFLVNGTIEGNATIQIPSATYPTPQNGDFFTLSTDVNGQDIEVDAAGAGVSRRVVIHSPSLPVEINGYRKITCSVIVDKFSS